jgi:cytochrome b6-f complex iron-sulfur subunit
MERNEFIKSLGLGMALVCTGSCFSGCGGGKSDDATPTPGGGGGGGTPGAGTKVNVDLSTQLFNCWFISNFRWHIVCQISNGEHTRLFYSNASELSSSGRCLKLGSSK